MLNAPYIRKHMLLALDQYILPALKNQQIAQVYASLPFQHTGVDYKILYRPLLPDNDSITEQILVTWKRWDLRAHRMGTLGFVYEGVSDERLGVTQAMAATASAAHQPLFAGITAFRLKAPAAFFFPPFTPRNNRIFNLGPATVVQKKLFLCDFYEEETLLRLSDESGTSTHLLSIKDITLKRLREEYLELLRLGNNPQAQIHLLAFMEGLKILLSQRNIPVCNSSWPTITLLPHSNTLSTKDQQICRQIAEYIRIHLHEPLDRKILAQKAGRSSDHLNRLFLQMTGMTLMRFVTYCRIQAAMHMLEHTSERVSDIALLTGFSGKHSFATVFKRHTQQSPRSYRQHCWAKT